MIDESSLYKNESVCTECLTGYALNKEKKCVECRKIEDIGGNSCRTCQYNDEKDKFECLSCYNSYDYVLSLIHFNASLTLIQINYIYMAVFKLYILKKVILMNA